MKLRTGMSGKLRAQMFFGGIAAVVGAIWLSPQLPSNDAQTFVAVVAIFGVVSVIGALIGLQDHSL